MSGLVKKQQLCKANITILQFYQFWPKNQQDKNYIFRTIFVSIPIGVEFLMLYAYILTALSSGKYFISELIEAITFAIVSFGMTIVLTTLARRQKKMNTLLDNISDFDEFGLPPTTALVEKRYNYIVHFYHVFCVITVLGFFLYSFYEMESCEEKNRKFKLNRICGVAFPTWVPFPVDSHTKLILILAIQLSAAAYAVGNLCGLNTFLCTVVESVLPRIRHLNEKLDKVFDNDDNNERELSLSFCVRYHEHIIGLVDEINLNFGFLYFFIFTEITVILTLLLLQLLLEPGIQVIIHIVAWFGPLFLISYSGQRLLNESESLTVAIYNTKWYTGSINQQKDILFMLIRSQNLLHLNPLGFGMISCQTFSNVMSNVYSFFNLVRQTV